MKEIYQVLSAAIGQEMRMDQIANNLANVNTPGFKKDGSVFLNELQAQLGGAAAMGQTSSAIPAGASWPSLPHTYMDLSTGPMQQTGRDLDIAIESEAFLKVRGRDGEICYTRAGNLAVNVDGKLTTSTGRLVLDDSGRQITIGPTVGAITITQEGRIMSGRTEVGKLGFARFANPGKLVKIGESLLAAPRDLPVESVDAPKVRQGVLEGSNVNPIDEMIRMIQVQRMYEAQQKVVNTFDELAQKKIESMQ